MYKSPLELIFTDISHQIVKQIDTDCYQAVVQYVPNVDKDELIRALQYDRDQYHKGYADGMRDAMDDLVRCKDCKYYREGEIFKDIKFCFRLRGDNDKPVGYNFSEDDFCSRGERREGE